MSNRVEVEEVLFPRAVLVDRREVGAYSFTGIYTDADQGRKPFKVLTRSVKLATGDYSLAGLSDEIAVERKSHEDLFHTLGQDRERFVKELTRLNTMKAAAVVVEAEWSEVLKNPPEGSQLPPKIVFRSVLTWNQQFPAVHWYFVPGRRIAELTVFRILERFGRRRQGKPQPE
jgi:ERCC4-type nuclease